MSSPAIRVLQRTKMGPGCWEWQGYRLPRGHGQIRVGKKTALVHRVMYEWAVGPIPAGRVVHHDCENPGCVNPDHLRALTPADHKAHHGGGEARARTGFCSPQAREQAANTRKERVRSRPCKRGHSPEHRAERKRGGSCCRECVRENNRASKARQRSR